MTLPDAIIFDLDGTLVNSAPDLQAAANVMLNDLGRAPLDLDTIITFIGNGVEKLIERSLEATGGYDDDLRRHALAVFLDTYETNMTTLTKPYPGVVNCLEQLCAAGVPLGICTNKPDGPAKAICAALGLSQFFTAIDGARPDQPRKPDPAPLLACIAKLNTAPQNALYVGDSGVDFLTAHNARVPFRLFSQGYLHAPIPELHARDQFSDWTLSNLLGR
ncbi:phosphoglycolate phosphatase [uncultured Aliiroseovarius sp.]|uniref:phosphoglycolate phosphatase n=1 Tax=uncultured Aliiroseovarius sp. TaxID=1658783 RepID=UPI002604B96A|nr:phosphoglycolate phosphatase [uncultured Aliiroseovarius sp.]